MERGGCAGRRVLLRWEQDDVSERTGHGVCSPTSLTVDRPAAAFPSSSHLHPLHAMLCWGPDDDSGDQRRRHPTMTDLDMSKWALSRAKAHTCSVSPSLSPSFTYADSKHAPTHAVML